MLECRCKDLGYRSDMNWDELTALMRTVETCTSSRQLGPYSSGYICPNIDKLLRKADAERSRNKYYEKKRLREGRGPGPIKQKKKLEAVDVNDLL